MPDAMAEAFVEDLARYDDSTLAAAMIEVRRTCKSTPRIAHIVEACRALSGERAGDTSTAEACYGGMRKRDAEAGRMAKEFVKLFRTHPLATAAREEGWGSTLMAYAYESAILQARFICRAANPGFNQNALTGRKEGRDR